MSKRPERLNKPGNIGALPEYFSPTLSTAVLKLLQGDLPNPTEQELNKILEPFFLHQPLVPLTNDQELFLRQDLRNLFDYVLSSRHVFSYLGGSCVLGESYGSPCFLTGNHFLKHVSDTEQKPLSFEEKLQLLTDPSFYSAARIHHESVNQSLLSNGTRHLCDEQSPGIVIAGHPVYESYGFTIDSFRLILAKIRLSQGKRANEKLIGLDIGGSNGLGAHDAEDLDPYLDMTNITIDPEIGVWPLRGGHRLMLAERMPIDFTELFDLVISNMAFRYMRYRDIALESAIRSLRIGGIICIFFSYDDFLKPGQTRAQINSDVNRIFQRMELLKDRGVINYLPVRDDFYDARQEWVTGQGNKIIRGMIFLQKTGHIPSD